MLGVTLFGIFLTPAFFVVVNYLSESRFFAAPALRWLRELSLGIVSLGVRNLRRLMDRRLSK
jgi:multidrug efflux pump